MPIKRVIEKIYRQQLIKINQQNLKFHGSTLKHLKPFQSCPRDNSHPWNISKEWNDSGDKWSFLNRLRKSTIFLQN